MATTPPFVAAADADAVEAALRTQLAGLPSRSSFYADLFAEHGIRPEDFDVSSLQQQLLANGAYLREPLESVKVKDESFAISA